MAIGLIEFTPQQRYQIYLKVWFYWHPEDQTIPGFEELAIFYYENLLGDMVEMCCFVVSLAALWTLICFVILYFVIWIIKYVLEKDPLKVFTPFIKNKKEKSKYEEWLTSLNDEKLKPLDP
jgi:hypothetical protein